MRIPSSLVPMGCWCITSCPSRHVDLVPLPQGNATRKEHGRHPISSKNGRSRVRDVQNVAKALTLRTHEDITKSGIPMEGRPIGRIIVKFVTRATAIFTMANENRIIARNINSHGYHVYDVMGAPLPPWSYSVGLNKRLGFELIFAGGLFFSVVERAEIFDRCVARLLQSANKKIDDEKGRFTLVRVAGGWPDVMFTGAIEFLGHRPDFFQIFPDEDTWTLDVPNMSKPWREENFPAWKWFHCSWNYSVSSRSHVLMDTDLLGGIARAEVMCRFGGDYWEVYSRQPDEIADMYKRLVPLGMLFAIEDTLGDLAVNLKIGEAVERLHGETSWVTWIGKVSR